MGVRLNWEKEHTREAIIANREFIHRKGKPWGRKLPKYQCNMCHRMEAINRLEHMMEMDELLIDEEKGHGTCPICRVSILFIQLVGMGVGA